MTASSTLLRPVASLGAAIAEVVAETCALIAPRRCPCGRGGAWLCPRCRDLLAAPPVRVDGVCDVLQDLVAARARTGADAPAGADFAPILPVFAIGAYEGPLQRLVIAWKNGGAAHLAQPLGRALAPAVEKLIADAGTNADFRENGVQCELRDVALMPVPSSLSARIRRGEDHTLELARELARRTDAHLLPARAVPSSTQSGAGSRLRRTRSMQLVRGNAEQIGTRDTVIIDDVITTGSTLRAMHDALTDAGHRVLGAVVIASARLPADSAGAPDRDALSPTARSAEQVNRQYVNVRLAHER